MITIPAIEIRTLGKLKCYMVALPFRVAAAIVEGVFDPDAPKNHPHNIRQRPLNTGRVSKLTSYITDASGPLDSVFTLGSVILSVSGEASFDGTNLTVGHESEWFINDGQHRLAAIRNALHAKDIEAEIPAIIYLKSSLRDQQQLFVDLNANAKKPSQPFIHLMDHRHEDLDWIRSTAEKIFGDRMEYSRLAPSRGKLLTLSAFVTACRHYGQGDDDDLFIFWSAVDESLWAPITDFEADRKANLRCHGIAVEALGRLSQVVSGSIRRVAEFDWRKREPFVAADGNRVLKTQANTQKLSEDLTRFIGGEVDAT